MRPQLEAAGLRVSGVFASKNLVEVLELPGIPWFVASQFHPEFKSRPTRPQPLFRDFVGAAVAQRDRRTPAATGSGAPPSRWRRSDEVLGLFLELVRIPSPPGGRARGRRSLRRLPDATSASSPSRTTRPGRSAARQATSTAGSLPRTGERGTADLPLRAHGHRAARRARFAPVVQRRRRDERRGRHPRRRQQGDRRRACSTPSARSCRAGTPHAGIELVLTAQEEVGLRGAKAFDHDRLHARIGYVFDHASPIGGMVLEAPSQYSIDARFLGPRGALGHRARGGPQRDRRRGACDRRDAARAHRRRDDREHRDCCTAAAPATSSPGCCTHAGRDPLARPGEGAATVPGDDRLDHACRRRRGLRGRDGDDARVRGLSAAALRARRRARRAGPRRLRLRARGAAHRRRRRLPRLQRAGPSVPQSAERHAGDPHLLRGDRGGAMSKASSASCWHLWKPPASGNPGRAYRW